MSEQPIDAMIPWLPEGRTLVVPGRGELFYRLHRHHDPSAPTVLLLHGWTATADLQFFTAYEALAKHFTFLVLDHRGHGRGLRADAQFELEDAADDAAALVEALGLAQVIAVGYSMGGPISMLLARRHPNVVRGIVVEATALEWCATRFERIRWRTVHLIGPLLRSFLFRRWLSAGLRRLLGPHSTLLRYVPWLAGELRRNDAVGIVQAGQALSRYDARPWAGELGKPAGALITTRDHLVKPRKQRALAEALHADVREIVADHACMWKRPEEFADATVELVEVVAAESSAVAA
ncbi:MAG TPA: alpha/beta fold hydrolase [Ilumatobacteraceae bacterium]|nr:alpha/beta fold hydrolase [Ilumatobacteraceae bacterium]